MVQPMLYPELYKAALWGLGILCSMLGAVLMLLYRNAIARIESLEIEVRQLLTTTLPKEYARREDMKESLDAIHQSIREGREDRAKQIDRIGEAVETALGKIDQKIIRIEQRIDALKAA